jgi:aspartyl-tRNA(Asn)/glutamyl-tRNA(Gln) amidotransferase subunit A
MSDSIAKMSATELASAFRGGALSATSIVESTLHRIARLDGRVGAFTAVTTERALAKAKALDRAREAGKALGLLAGVPFAVKNLFDLEGVVTLAGSKVHASDPPAARDAALVARMEAAGAICVGALNMGEYAYDFTGENIHHGPSRNPHDLDHMTGGSSGGSGAAVAAGFVPIALASDTNGSIRVPASLCGLYGLKPTYGRLTRAGTFPFVASLDHLGPLARSVEDLALAYDSMQGPDVDDPACAERPAEPVTPLLDRGAEGLRIAIASGYFAERANPEAIEAVERCAKALGASRIVEIPEAARARAAAFLITTTEGAALHLDRLRERSEDFDPAVRDRLLAGAMLPAPWVAAAQKFRRWFQGEMRRLFETVDIIIAPATPCRAPRIGQTMMRIGDAELPVRANLGLFTQPISFVGLPVATVPLWTQGERLPIGVQLIGPAFREDFVLRAAEALSHQPESRSRVAFD